MKKNQSPRLNRDLIIEHGLKLAHLQGVDNITLRKLADRLDVTPMALYRHFTNKDELLGEMLDTFIQRANVLPQASMPWQQWLSTVASNMFEALKAQPSWIPVFPNIRLKPAALEVMHHCTDRLLAAGFTKIQARKAIATMVHCLLGAVIMHSDEYNDSGATLENSMALLISGLEQEKSLH